MPVTRSVSVVGRALTAYAPRHSRALVPRWSKTSESWVSYPALSPHGLDEGVHAFRAVVVVRGRHCSHLLVEDPQVLRHGLPGCYRIPAGD